MMQLRLHEHVVMRGESLATIAAKYKLASWKSLYDAPCNADLRRNRPNPRLLQPGDKVRIPPDARQLAQLRLQKLRALKMETEATFNRMQRELNREFGKVTGVGQAVDTVAMVAQIFLNLGGMIKEAQRITKLTGTELTKANQQLVSTHMKGYYERGTGVAAQAGMFDVTGDEWEVWAFGKVVIKSWFDMTSPSYWAGVITKWKTGQTPQEAFQQAQQHLERTRADVINRLNQRIRETERLLGDASAPAPPMH